MVLLRDAVWLGVAMRAVSEHRRSGHRPTVREQVQNVRD
jgi:hypothetical protein